MSRMELLRYGPSQDGEASQIAFLVLASDAASWEEGSGLALDTRASGRENKLGT